MSAADNPDNDENLKFAMQALQAFDIPFDLWAYQRSKTSTLTGTLQG